MTSTAVTIVQNQVVVIGQNELEVTIMESKPMVIEVGTQGAPGVGVPTGGLEGQILEKASDANFDMRWADAPAVGNLSDYLVLGETTSAYRMVYADLDGKVYKASADDVLTASSVRGITVQAGDTDDEVLVVSEGEVENSSWNWSGNQNLYLGIDGVVTNTPPDSGYFLRVGYSVAPQKMFVTIGQSVLLT